VVPSETTELVIWQICPCKSKAVVSTHSTIMSQLPPRNFSGGNSRKDKHVDKPAAPGESPPSNGLLAGYLAHEFLTKGTLLGRRTVDSTRPDLSGYSSVKEHGRYEEVSRLLKIKGTYIKGIVNPTQLSKWINK